MKKTLSLVLAALMLVAMFTLTSCSNGAKDISGATSIADLSGARIAAQAGTFHVTAMNQIKATKSATTYPDFTDLLTALNSGAIDGYIAEEPTALAVCLKDSTLDYLHLVNNTTGFTATAADTGIAVALKTGSELREKINTVLAEIPVETRMKLMEEMVKLSNGETVAEYSLKSDIPETTEGTLKVAMECAYAPFNWTDSTTKTNGAVAISGEGKDGLFANGYDVQIAQYVANKLGMKLEIYSYEWDSLIPALQAGTVDAIVAGMSPTAAREEQVDFTNVYYESNLVVIFKKK